MSETVELKKDLRNRKSVFVVTNTPVRLKDGSEQKHRIHLQKPENSKQISLIKRIIQDDLMVPSMIGFDASERGSTLSERYVRSLALMRKRGMPVVETARIVSDNEVAVTDEKVEGGTVFDLKEERSKFFYPKKYGERDTQFDEFLFGIPKDELKNEVDRISKVATLNGIEIATDSPFHLILFANGDWKIKSLDIAFTRIWKKPENANWDSYFINVGETLEDANRKTAENWISNFIDLEKRVFEKPSVLRM